jgi:hypothetical protein
MKNNLAPEDQKQGEDGIEYVVDEVPAVIPEGRVLVHNDVTWAGPGINEQGFRAWLALPSPSYTPCACRWAPGHPQHFRTAEP